MDLELKQNICKFLKYLKEEVALFALNKEIDEQIISIEPLVLTTYKIDKELLPEIIKILIKEKIIVKELKLDSKQIDILITSDNLCKHPELMRCGAYNIILTNDFYKNYKLISKKLGCNNGADNIITNKPTYDSKKKILTFQGKQIEFAKKRKQYEILDCLFEDLTREWEYIDIEEKLDPEFDFTDLPGIKKDQLDKSRYNSSGEINNNIAKKTTCIDFLIKDMKKVKINPEYLKK